MKRLYLNFWLEIKTNTEVELLIENIKLFSRIQYLSLFPQFASQDVAEYFFLNFHKIQHVINLYFGIDYWKLKKALPVYNAFKAFYLKAHHLENLGFGLTSPTKTSFFEKYAYN